jgi:DNA-binding Lrp family transcriptional regulator
MRIDDTDFAILKCIQDFGKPLWKNKIHESITERADELPLKSSVSVQTVGRRVDDLTDDGFVESAIISPDEIKRDLIIAFKLTDQGRDAIRERTEEYLQNVVQSSMFTIAETDHIGKPALLELIEDNFGIDDEMKDRLDTEYDRDELVTLLTLYYVKQEISDVFTDGDAEKFVDLTEDSREISEALHRYMTQEEGAS